MDLYYATLDWVVVFAVVDEIPSLISHVAGSERRCALVENIDEAQLELRDLSLGLTCGELGQSLGCVLAPHAGCDEQAIAKGYRIHRWRSVSGQSTSWGLPTLCGLETMPDLTTKLACHTNRPSEHFASERRSGVGRHLARKGSPSQRE